MSARICFMCPTCKAKMDARSLIHRRKERSHVPNCNPAGANDVDQPLTPSCSLRTMNDMKTTQKNLIPPKLLAELQEAADRVSKGIRDPKAMKKAAKDMDRMREETRKQHGILDVAVDLIREGREEV